MCGGMSKRCNLEKNKVGSLEGEPMKHGYAGKILYLDLSNERVYERDLPSNLVEDYLGGRGFVARLLYEEVPKRVHPLGPKNQIVISTGPLTGHFLPGSGKTHFGAISPATGGYGDSNMGGHFGPTLKYAGYDSLVLRGRADSLSLIIIDNGEVELVDAEKWKGVGALKTEKGLKEELGEDFEIITIGPAGENEVVFACISHDFGRQAGRTGVGAVMGSKNIKAIAIRGSGGLPLYDEKKAFDKGREMFQVCFEKPGFKAWTPYGTASITNWVNEVGAFPTKNFQTSYAPFHRAINGEAIIQKLLVTHKGCFGCPTPCGKYGFTKTPLGEAYVEGPEYESIATLGGSCLLETIEEVAYANYICDELGLDTISAGVVASFAMESYEKSILSKKDVGIELEFGSLEGFVYLMERVAKREGIGDILAQGVRHTARVFGEGSEEFAIHVKGLEWSGYECRNAPGMMLAYMTADVGAHHNRAWVLGQDVAGSGSSVHDLLTEGREGEIERSTLEGKAQKVIHLQHTRPLFDVLGVCRLQSVEIGFETHHYEEAFQYITGRTMNWEEMCHTTERIWNLTRLINQKHIEGFGREDDYPPGRFMREPIPSGPNKGRFLPREDLDRLLDEYYLLRGWDENGLPKEETLEKMGLP